MDQKNANKISFISQGTASQNLKYESQKSKFKYKDKKM